MLGGSVNIKHLFDAALLDSIDVSVRPIAMVYCYGFSTGFNLSESDEVCHTFLLKLSILSATQKC